LLSFSTAGTGGFGLLNSSAGSYNDYTQIVLAIFMLLFGVNFNVYYLVLIRNFSKAFKCEEVRVYLVAILVATLAIAINVTSLIGNFGQALKHAFFQVTSISSTTGLTTYDYTTWPAFSQAILLLLTVVGACGGSTGGGMKFARVCILCKSCSSEFKRLIHPRAVVTTKFEGEPVTKDTENNVKTFFILWVLIVVVSTLILSLDSTLNASVLDNFSATLACIGNVGPGFGPIVGPTCNYAGYSDLSTILLSFVMLVGRLEIFPILILFAPRTWKRA
jgi:trk system potassium uptake protein TrkH